MKYTKQHINSIIDKHRKFRLNEDGGERANLSGAILSGADLSWANLSGADLSDADLSGADLSWANLSDADLSGAILSGADLSWANLSWAELSGADLSGANLSWANLSEANLRIANLSGADLSGADLSWANLFNCIGNREVIRSFQLDQYSVTYTAEVMQIGCKRYTFEQWMEFTDREIFNMDGKAALQFWRKWKDAIFMLVEMAPATPTDQLGKEG